MSNHRLTACLTICSLLLLLLPIYGASAQNYFEYKVQILSDGSAAWTVTQFSSANATVDTFDSFQQKVFNLVDSAANVTGREMAVDENSLQINITVLPESKTTEYTFLWENFSVVQGSEISFGDVFQVSDFFSQLYGDAALQLTYPSEFTVKSATPIPYERIDSAEILKWSRTQDLVNNPVSVVLAKSNLGTPGQSSNWQVYAIAIAVLAVAAVLSLFGFYRFRRRKNKSAETAAETSLFQREEEKIMKLLKSAGGSMRQSKITEQLGFSKAKTSQLLTGLEKNGDITRYKNGRDKIVTLKERGRSE